MKPNLLIVAIYYPPARRIMTLAAAALLALGALMPAVASAARVTRMDVPEPTTYEAAEGVSVDQVRAAVIRAAGSERWRTNVMVDGRVKAEYSTKGGKHSATVTIAVDEDTYLIQYRDSHQMGYRRSYCSNRALGNHRVRQARPCSNGGIHPYYNDWIDELDYAIKDEISMLTRLPEDAVGEDEVPDPMTERERFEIAEQIRRLIAMRDAGEIDDPTFEDRKRALLLR